MARRALQGLVLLLASAAAAAAQAHGAEQERARQALVTLQRWYSPAGVYATTGWWNSANALTAVANYDQMAGTREHAEVLRNSLEQAQQQAAGFLNNFYDDEGWWALSWVAAYDETGEQRYLEAAKAIFADMRGGWDGTCGGGIWWSKDRTYKNAIANELFLSVAAHLANRVSAGEKEQYATWAKREWSWFAGSGMINGEHLINDGLVLTTCRNNGKTTWTYNQGVILGGLLELSRATGDKSLQEKAETIADAAMTKLADGNGILHDVCEPRCGDDGVQFKGIFARNLMELANATHKQGYAAFLRVNADSVWDRSRDAHDALGQVWSGPFDTEAAGSQSSALDVLIAAAAVEGWAKR